MKKAKAVGKPLRRRKLEVTGPDQWGSMYVYLKRTRKGGVVGTKHMSEVYCDYDKSGNLVGIEIFDIREKL